MDIITNVIYIVILLLLLSSVAITIYINIFDKDTKKELNKETHDSYYLKMNRTLGRYKVRALANPNKRYEIKANYRGILMKKNSNSMFYDHLTDEDLEQLKKEYEGSRVKLEYYYDDFSKFLVFVIRFPKFTTNKF